MFTYVYMPTLFCGHSLGGRWQQLRFVFVRPSVSHACLSRPITMT